MSESLEARRRALLAKLEECQRHSERIRVAKKNLAHLFPMSASALSGLSDVEQGFLDQLVYRFSKLQDTLGEGVFPLLLELGGEQVRGKTYFEILDKIEEFGIADRALWMQMRELRNEIAHEHASEGSQLSQKIERIYGLSGSLTACLERSIDFCK